MAIWPPANKSRRPQPAPTAGLRRRFPDKIDILGQPRLEFKNLLPLFMGQLNRLATLSYFGIVDHVPQMQMKILNNF